jgi:hypothetical protein
LKVALGQISSALRDRRGTREAEILNISEKSETLGSDPLAIYNPSGAKHVDVARRWSGGILFPNAGTIFPVDPVANVLFLFS